jgi:hypothetical protein
VRAVTKLAPMARWLIQLEGDRFDLEEFPRWFPDGDIFFTEENGAFFLTGPAFEHLPDHQAVRVEAMRGLEECLAAILVLSPSVRNPTVGNVFREEDGGKRHTFIFLEAATLRARGKVAGTLSGGTQSEAAGPTQAQQLLAVARANPRLLTAVSLWARPGRSWPRLYTIMEEIEGHFGRHVDGAGLCSPGKRERFCRSANTAEVSGADSRHAAGRFEPPKTPMNLQGATSFMRGLLDRALRKP